MAREIRGVQGSEFGGFRHDRSSGGALGAEGRYADSFMGEATATRGGFAPAILRGASAAWRTQRKRRRDGEVDVVKVSIRPATWDDRAAILALVVTMGGHEDVAQHMDPLRELGAMLRSSYARTFVADVDGAVAGVANVQARSSLTEDARIAILSSVAVSESQRGRGIGTLLLDAVDEAARSLGCTGIALQSARVRTGAHAFIASMATWKPDPRPPFGAESPSLQAMRRSSRNFWRARRGRLQQSMPQSSSSALRRRLGWAPTVPRRKPRISPLNRRPSPNCGAFRFPSSAKKPV